MPEIGGSKLATNFGSMMADIRKEIDTASETVAEAVRELKAEITVGAQSAAKAIRTEAATVRSGYAELLGNNPPQTTVADTKPVVDAVIKDAAA